MKPPTTGPRSRTVWTRSLVAVLLAALTLASGIEPPAQAQKAAVPAALALVPPESVGFMHLRVADFLATDTGKTLEQVVRSVAPDLGAGFQRYWGVPLADLDTVTLVLINLRSLRGDPGAPAVPGKIEIRPDKLEAPAKKPCGEEQAPDEAEEHTEKHLTIFTTRKALDRDQILKVTLPEREEAKHKGKTYYRPTRPAFRSNAVAFLDDRTFMLGTPSTVRRALELPAQAVVTGPLGPALTLAAQKHHVVVGFQFADKVAAEWKREIKAEQAFNRDTETLFLRALLPLLDARSGTLFLDLGADSRASAQMRFADAARAREALGAAQDGLVLLRLLTLGGEDLALDDWHAGDIQPEQEYTYHFSKQAVKQLEAALRAVKVEQRDDTLYAEIQARTDLATWLAEAKTKAKTFQSDPELLGARHRRWSSNNLRQIGLAMHNYESTYTHMPMPAIYLYLPSSS